MVVPMLWGITLLNFLIMNMAPGDPLSSLMTPDVSISVAEKAKIAHRMGLDQPLPVRYVVWLTNAVQGNFGYKTSYSDWRPVLPILLEAIPKTVELMFLALLVANVMGIGLGILCAVWRYSRTDYILTVFAFFGVSAPGFFVAIGLMYLVAFRWGVLPISGYPPTGDDSFGGHVRYLILPATALAVQYVAGMLRYTRTAVLEVLGHDYVVSASAKGLKWFRVVFVHVLRNAMLPLLTIIGLQIPGLFGGSIVIETIFGWPGIGRIAMEAIHARDYNLLMATSMFGSTIVLIASLFIGSFPAFIFSDKIPGIKVMK